MGEKIFRIKIGYKEGGWEYHLKYIEHNCPNFFSSFLFEISFRNIWLKKKTCKMSSNCCKIVLLAMFLLSC